VLPLNANCWTLTLSCGVDGIAGRGSGGLGSTGSAGGGRRNGSRVCSRTWPESGRCCAWTSKLASISTSSVNEREIFRGTGRPRTTRVGV